MLTLALADLFRQTKISGRSRPSDDDVGNNVENANEDVGRIMLVCVVCVVCVIRNV